MRTPMTLTKSYAWTALIAVVFAICFGCGTSDVRLGETQIGMYNESSSSLSSTTKNDLMPLSRSEVHFWNSIPAHTTLNTVVPPCIPFPETTVDPCQRRNHWKDNNPYVEVDYEFPEIFPTFREILMDRAEIPYWAIQFVVRATVIPGSTRCAWTEVERSHWLEFEDGYARSNEEGESYCYYDLAVNEYLHGTGPALLTVNFGAQAWGGHSPCDSQCLAEGAKYIEDFAGYEGVEWIVYLGGPSDLGTKAWLTFGFDDVQRREDGEVVVVSEWKQRAPRDTAAINWSRLEWTLADFRVVVSEAYKSFKTLTGGRTGNVRDRLGRLPPFFAEDAGPDGFTNFITSTKLLDGTDITPSPPPPVPGEGDPNPSGLTTNDIIATRVAGDVKIPGGLTDFETPVPTLGDEPTATATVEPTATATEEPTATATTVTEVADTPTPEPTATVEPTATPEPTVTPEPAPTPEPTLEPTATTTPEPAPTPEPADTPTPESEQPIGPGAEETPEDPIAPGTGGNGEPGAGPGE